MFYRVYPGALAGRQPLTRANVSENWHDVSMNLEQYLTCTKPWQCPVEGGKRCCSCFWLPLQLVRLPEKLQPSLLDSFVEAILANLLLFLCISRGAEIRAAYQNSWAKAGAVWVGTELSEQNLSAFPEAQHISSVTSPAMLKERTLRLVPNNL